MRIRFDRKYGRFQVEAVQAAIVKAVAVSRFSLSCLELQWREFRWELKTGSRCHSGIRLRNKKDYCGQHAGPCPVRAFSRKHPISSRLEGADWVGWNDGLNDILDELGVVADVFSYNRESRANRFYIRRGRCRRVSYLEEYPFRERPEIAGWLEDVPSDFEDWCGKPGAPRSAYTGGTPGIPCWTLEDEARLAKEFAHVD